MSTIRGKVRAVTYLAAALLISTGFAIKGYMDAQWYRSALENTYVRAVEDLAAYTENIAATLEKGMYTGTPAQLETLSARLWKDAAAAKASLSQLPTSGLNLENTYKFLAQVGEYAVSLSKKAAEGEKLTDEEYENLQKLSGYADSLEESMMFVQDAVRTGADGLTEAIPAGVEAEPPVIGEDLSEFEEGFTAYPTLIYDGPFSDHLLQKEPETLKEAQDISREAARSRAADAFNVDSESILDNGDEEGMMPSYCFSFGDKEISVTKKGGYITYLIDPRLVLSQKLSPEEAVYKAENYLRWLEIPSMTMTYYEIADNILTANFAAVQGDFTLYTDLIKVSVAMDDGGIVSFDARGYLTNHYERELPAPRLTAGEAAASLSSLLEIQSTRLALIPSDGQNELYCYEFRCRGAKDGQEVLVYVNCETGEEEQILILLISENGALVI